MTAWLRVMALVAAFAPPLQAGIGAVFARVRSQISWFHILDKVLGSPRGPVQASAVAPPAPPANLRIVGRAGVALELAWDVPAAGPGRAIVRYEVRRNGVVVAQPVAPGASIAINPTGAALESFTVAAIDDHGVASAASGAVVAVRGSPVPFGFQRRTAIAESEGGNWAAEAALVAATSGLPSAAWGTVVGAEPGDPLLLAPLTVYLAARLRGADGAEVEHQILTQGEYRLRIGPPVTLNPDAPFGPGFGPPGTGQPDAEIPLGAVVPVRWAEVFQSFEDEPPEVLAVRRTDLTLTAGESVSPAYFVPVPRRAGWVEPKLLPILGEWNAHPLGGIAGGSSGVLVPGQAAEIALFDPVGTDYSRPQAWPLMVTVEGPVGVVRIVAIDPALEQAQGWETALADGIEVPPGTEFAAQMTPDGRRTAGRRLVVIGLKPGVVRVAVGVIGAPETGEARTITVLPRIELAVDADRDGNVTLARENASDRVTTNEPFRFWVNDDDDEGDLEGTDIPQGAAADANFQDGVVNGARDLVDFFPVFLDLAGALAVLHDGASVKVLLRQADGAVNFAYTAMDRSRAEAHWRTLPASGYGDAFGHEPGAAETHRVTADGVELSAAFLAGVRDHARGVLLVEGRSPTLAPLVLEIEREGAVITEAQLDLRLSNVEEMFRHVDLTGVPTEYDGTKIVLPEKPMPPRLTDPGEAWPDRPGNEKYFVFVHGYNVDAQVARGWQSEVFKRLHVLGSRAKFVGVTWHGATGLRVANGYLDYHKAVYNALQTGGALKDALKFTAAAPLTIAAHSLGNGVVGQAIQFGGFRPDHYIMIDAALPVETYDPAAVTADVVKDMVEYRWTGYDPRLHAAHWFERFPESDARHYLTWQGRFSEVASRTDLHHFYSSGEEVLKNAEGVHSPSVFEWVLREKGSLSEGAWKMQELAKGLDATSSLGAILLSRGQAGWGFAVDWMLSPSGGHNTGINPRLRTPQETAAIPSEALMGKPFFGEFKEHDLTSPDATVASAKAAEPRVLFDLLARAIPAKSYAAGANRIPVFEAKNFDMNTKGHPSAVISLPTPTGQWGHSDLKLLALPLSYPMYLELVQKGDLR